MLTQYKSIVIQTYVVPDHGHSNMDATRQNVPNSKIYMTHESDMYSMRYNFMVEVYMLHGSK